MVRKVYIEPLWTIHAGQDRLVAHPPAGYECIVNETRQEKLFRAATRWGILRFLLRSSDGLIPTALFKSWLDRRNKLSNDIVLTYSCEHLVLRQEPWVVEMEHALPLAGLHRKHLKRFKGTIEKALGSHYCKRIFCWSRAGQNTLLSNLDPSSFRHKIEVVPYSVPPKPFVKEYGGERVKLLFVGGGTPTEGWQAFEGKGGREALETFVQLRQRFTNLEIVVRCDVPPDIKAQYGGMEGVRIIEEYIPLEEMEREYQSADILILPSRTTVPVTTLDAMSYELPVVTINAWANAEHVEDGKTGLVAPWSKEVLCYSDTFEPTIDKAQYKATKRVSNSEIVRGMTERVSLLIENPELRQRLGRAARWEIENGKFCLRKINEQLGRIFDEAINGNEGKS